MAIPVNIVFSPSWWFHHYGISFQQPFYLDPATRIRNDVAMRRALYERFGLGAEDPQPRPVIGSRHIAGGLAVPAVLGVEIRFADDQAAWPVPRNLSRDEVMGLRVPDLDATWPMREILRQMDQLEREFGYVTGDLNTAGVLNTAIDLRGQQFFIDLLEDAEAADHLCDVVARTQLEVARRIKARTGTCAIATNRSIVDVDPAIFLTSNCSTHMISTAVYEARLLRFEQFLAAGLQPFGIHHCGNNLHRYAPVYARVPACFFDVGWGSDAAQCSRALPDAFLNLRLSPVRLLQATAEEVYADVRKLLDACGRRERVGVCAINLDRDTPDENVRAMFRAARDFDVYCGS